MDRIEDGTVDALATRFCRKLNEQRRASIRFRALDWKAGNLGRSWTLELLSRVLRIDPRELPGIEKLTRPIEFDYFVASICQE